MKEIIWNKSAREYVFWLSKETKKNIGELLFALQKGMLLKAPDVKPMKVIHQNAYELRVKDKQGQHRLIYVLVLKDKIIIPHAFIKKTQKTEKIDIDTAIKRLKEML